MNTLKMTVSENKKNLLTKIKNNNAALSNEVNKVLILYELNTFIIGDTCLQTSRFLKIKSFYPHAIIDVNTVDSKNYSLVNTIILNNPYIHSFFNLSWDEIDFENYEIVIVACIPEETFFNFLCNKYGNEALYEKLTSSIYSVTGLIGFDEVGYGEVIFPKHDKLINYQLPETENSKMMANMLFISEQEQSWATNWLSSFGLLGHEHIAIFLDNASSREKLLKTDVYVGILSWFIEKTNMKILILDEKKMGKKFFYLECFEPKFSNRFIFAEGLNLRETIPLIGNRSVKFIFGPSTGILHCASGIYNVLAEQGLSIEDIPIMITYIGKLEKDYEEHLWWGNSLTDGILLIENEKKKKEIKNIKEVNFLKLQKNNSFFPSSDFTSEGILEYIKNNYHKKLMRCLEKA